MANVYNIEMNMLNSSGGYDVIYPRTDYNQLINKPMIPTYPLAVNKGGTGVTSLDSIREKIFDWEDGEYTIPSMATLKKRNSSVQVSLDTNISTVGYSCIRISDSNTIGARFIIINFNIFLKKESTLTTDTQHRLIIELTGGKDATFEGSPAQGTFEPGYMFMFYYINLFQRKLNIGFNSSTNNTLFQIAGRVHGIFYE